MRVVTLSGGSPWGFRLVGGSDFHASLAISKVTPGGKASQKGLKPGDVIQSINGVDSSNLSHLEAQNHVKSSTSELTLTIKSAGEANSAPAPVAPAPTQNYSSPPSSNKPSTFTSTVTIPSKPWQPSQNKVNPPQEKRNDDFLPPPPSSMLQNQPHTAAADPVPMDDLPPPPRSVVTVPVSNTSTTSTQDLICEGCRQLIRGPYLTAQGKNWHPDEFVCSSQNCRRPLKDCGFIEEEGGRYCSGCYERYYAKSCGKCRMKIVGEVMHALSQDWHVNCFVCTACEKPFRDGVFQMEHDKPYCVADYNRLFSTMCKGCGFPIEAGDHYVEAIKAQWHETCFTCAVCHCDLKNAGFFAINAKPVCSNHKNARLPA